MHFPDLKVSCNWSTFYSSIQQTFVRLGAGKRDEPLRTSAWEATCLLAALPPLALHGTED